MLARDVALPFVLACEDGFAAVVLEGADEVTSLSARFLASFVTLACFAAVFALLGGLGDSSFGANDSSSAGHGPGAFRGPAATGGLTDLAGKSSLRLMRVEGWVVVAVLSSFVVIAVAVFVVLR